MATLFRFNLRRKGFPELLTALDKSEAFVNAPLAGPRGLQVERVMRKGTAKQFDQGGDPSWPPSRDFGRRAASRPTLGGSSGTIGHIWANAPVEKGPREVRLRVSDVRALAHQRGATIKPKQDPSKMRFALGMGFGVWMTEERLQVGFVLPKRPIRYTDEMILASKAALFLGFEGAA